MSKKRDRDLPPYEWFRENQFFGRKANKEKIRIHFPDYGTGQVERVAPDGATIRFLTDQTLTLAPARFMEALSDTIDSDSRDDVLAQYQQIQAQKHAEQEQRGKEKQPVPHLEEVAQTASTLAFPALFDPRLETRDAELARLWIAKSEDHDDWELGRMLSARLAEKAVLEYYRATGSDVIDIALKQLTEPPFELAAKLWRSGDLKVDGRLYDVKNARRSLSSPDSYSELCLPRWKQERSGSNVVIVGALSQYLRAEWILRPETRPAGRGTEILVLGETDLAKHNAITAEFAESGRLTVDMTRAESGPQLFLPPWFFDQPPRHYQQRDIVLAELHRIQLPAADLWITYGGNPTALYLAAGLPLDDRWPRSARTGWRAEFIDFMRLLLASRGLGLPFVFLAVLSHFVAMANREAPADYAPSQYRTLLFWPTTRDSSWPVFVYDPLKTVAGLIDTLSVLWGQRDQITRYDAFRLRGFNLLQGRKQFTSTWDSLVAYCGGRLEGRGKCGKYPLVVGRNDTCPACHRLVCTIPGCGYCSGDCDERRSRDGTMNRPGFSEDNVP